MTYTREELKAWIEHWISDPCPFCPYCGCRLSEKNFSVDHSQPLTRNGGYALENLTVCCKPCNTAKGILTRDEFTQLSELARSWPDCAANNLFGRLKAGGIIVRAC